MRFGIIDSSTVCEYLVFLRDHTIDRRLILFLRFHLIYRKNGGLGIVLSKSG